MGFHAWPIQKKHGSSVWMIGNLCFFFSKKYIFITFKDVICV
jgi:hypothetical protein